MKSEIIMKRMKRKMLSICILFLVLFSSCKDNTYNLSDYGLKPDSTEDSSPLFASALEAIKKEHADSNEPLKIILDPGRYDFYPSKATGREYFISNHDQDNPKLVGLVFENMKNVVFDGQGAELIFHGRMLPVSVINTKDCSFKNFSIDFENPHISQIRVIENDTLRNTITFEVAPWVAYDIRDSLFVAKGEGWEHTPVWGIAFEEETKRVVYRTSDISLGVKKVEEIKPRIIKSYNWKNPRLIAGTTIAMRSYKRPAPGIFMSYNLNTTLENIRIYYSEGMGLLAQMSENITLDGFCVCLRGDDDPRYFTTQADATHFSGCKGKITSINGLYEGMMDDAINVHGTYLKVIKRVDDKKLIACYMHGQSYGFEWGYVGDTVRFVQSNTMEHVGDKNKIAAIRPTDKLTAHGAKEFEISFENALDTGINESGTFGIENLEWTPGVLFANNIIRNNRARGALFSTPKATLVENNIFDHTSGTAILLCGDCNGWFETGACDDVAIRNNKFINSLTSMFQFTNAIISIYPEIPNLKDQEKYFHSGIVIENNVFETFDVPIVYAKSVDGLIFRNNTIKKNTDYPAFHWNKEPFLFERVTNEVVELNLTN